MLANDTDPNNAPLTALLITGPAHGTLALNGNGSFTYTPAAGFYGTDSFVYQAFDGQAYSAPATVTLTVFAPPVASNDSYVAQENTPLTVSGLSLSSGALLRYLFDESSSGNAPAIDSGAAPAAAGTFFGAATRTGDTPQSGSTGALDLTAGSGLVSAGSVSQLQNLSALTLTAWVDLRSVPANGSVLMSENATGLSSPAGSGGWELLIGQPASNTSPLSAANFGLQFTVYQSEGSYTNGQSLSSTALNAADRWVFLAVTFNANHVVSYYVGDPTDSVVGAGSATYSFGLGPDSAPFVIGAAPYGSGSDRTPPAWMDDVRVYGSALSAAQLDSIRREDLGQGALANDVDPQGLPLTATLVTGPAHGSVTLNTNGTFTYTPAANFVGTDSFTYQASNGQALSNVATVTLTVGAAAPPTAGNDAYSTAMNTALSVATPGVLGNDSDPGNQPLTAVLVAGPAHGGLSLSSDGSFTYTPATGFYGTDSFTYQASDGSHLSNVATVTLTVGQPPVANNDSESTLENTALTVAAPGLLANDTDPNNAPLTAVLVAGPAHGQLTLDSDGSFTYTPAANYHGTDSFTYQASDGPFLSNVATVNLTVLQPPVAGNDFYTTPVNTALAVAAPGVLANDSDPNDLPLTAILVTNPAHGAVTLNASGSFTYTPTTGFFGTDSFTYKDSDGWLTGNVATVNITVGQPPTANNDGYTTDQNSPLTITAPGVLSNDSDPNGGSLAAVVVTDPAHGSLSLNADGSFTYTPAANFFGTDSFTYRATDAVFASSAATVTISVGQPPVARPDSYTLDENAPLAAGGGATYVMMDSQPGDYVGGGLNYDFTPGNGTITGRVYGSQGVYTNAVEIDVSVSGQFWTLDFAAPGEARLTPGTYLNATRWPFNTGSSPGLDIDGDGRGANTLTGQFTVTQVTYDASGNLTSFAASFVQHSEGASPALIGQVAFNATASQPGGVLANDSDPNVGATLTAALVGGPSHGTVALNPDGSFLYTPAAGFTGTDSFTYQDSDGTFTSNLATVTINVVPPPVANSDSFDVNENTPLVVAAPGVLANDSDSSGGTLTPFLVAGPADGTLTLNADGSFTYTPASNFQGTDSFSYEVGDGMAFSGVATVTLTVTPSASTATVNLAAHYNRIGIFSDGTSYANTSGLDGLNAGYSGQQLVSPITWGGQTFTFGPVGAPDAVAAVGQNIPLTEGTYSTVLFLATGVNGNQAGLYFTVNYADGLSTTFMQSFSDWASPQGYNGESVVSTMPYRDFTNGTTEAGTFRLYGYSATLQTDSEVVSITLPSDPDVDILAMDVVAGTPTAPPPPPSNNSDQVNLSGSVNVTGIFANGTTYPGAGGLDGFGGGYSANLLGSQLTWDGQTFAFGPVGAPDAVSAAGQTIPLPSGSDTQLLMLGTGVNGNQNGLTFTVHYADGTNATFTQGFSDWYTPQGYAGESVASTLPYRDFSSGSNQAGPFNLYGYDESLDPGKTVVSITLPYDPNVDILAMELVSGGASGGAAAIAGPSDLLAVPAASGAMPGNLAAVDSGQVGVTASGVASLPVPVDVVSGYAAPVAKGVSSSGGGSRASAAVRIGMKDHPLARRWLLRGQRDARERLS